VKHRCIAIFSYAKFEIYSTPYLRRDEIFVDYFIANLLFSLTMKES